MGLSVVRAAVITTGRAVIAARWTVVAAGRTVVHRRWLIVDRLLNVDRRRLVIDRWRLLHINRLWLGVDRLLHIHRPVGVDQGRTDDGRAHDRTKYRWTLPTATTAMGL